MHSRNKEEQCRALAGLWSRKQHLARSAHCTAPHHAALHFINAMPYYTMLYCIAQHSTTPQHHVVLHCTAPHHVVLHRTAPHRVVLYCTAPQCVVLHCTAPHHVVLDCTAPDQTTPHHTITLGAATPNYGVKIFCAVPLLRGLTLVLTGCLSWRCISTSSLWLLTCFCSCCGRRRCCCSRLLKNIQQLPLQSTCITCIAIYDYMTNL